MPLKRYRCGLLPSLAPPRMRFSTYLMAAQLPAIPAAFGHQNLIGPHNWQMLANDSIGDCTIAGACHASMLWNRIAGKTVTFTNLDATEDYSAVSGYVPGDPSTDNGADMVAVAAYWKNTGVRDITAARHQIGAYVSINVAMLDHIYAACYLFDCVGLGVNLPSSAEDQFDAQEPWSVVNGDEIEGMHFVPMISRDSDGTLGVVTWGSFQPITEAWLSKYLVEAVGYISPEALSGGKSAEGFDMPALQADLGALA